MIEEPLLTQDELEEGAFLLLSSSTINRYARVAKQLAMRSRLRERLVRDPSAIREVVDYGRAQWRALALSTQRDVPEVELAFLLCLLAETALPEVDDLFSDIGLNTRPAAAWVAALARDLRAQRPTNTQKTVMHAPSELGLYGLIKGWVFNAAQLYDPKLTVASPPEKASQSSLKLAA